MSVEIEVPRVHNEQLTDYSPIDVHAPDLQVVPFPVEVAEVEYVQADQLDATQMQPLEPAEALTLEEVDHQLMLRNRALGALVSDPVTARRLHLHALRYMGGDHAAAEDLVSLAILKLARSKSFKVTEGQDLAGLAMNTIRWVSIDEWRRNGTRPDEYPEAMTEWAPSAGEMAQDGNDLYRSFTPSETPVVETRVVLEGALAYLSKAHRQIIELVYLKGLSIPEAAEVAGLRLGTAKSRVYYALRALRTELQQQGIEHRGDIR